MQPLKITLETIGLVGVCQGYIVFVYKKCALLISLAVLQEEYKFYWAEYKSPESTPGVENSPKV